jgi:hypothetical protein
MNVPGCFGSPTIYASGSSVCVSCEGHDLCRAESTKVIAALREEIPVEALIKRHDAIKKPKVPVFKTTGTKIETPKVVGKETVTVSPAHQQLIEQIANNKARAPIVAMSVGGLLDDFIVGVRNRKLTAERPLWLVSAARSMFGGPTTRETITDAIKTALPSWSDGTVQPHVSMAISILIGLNLVEPTDDANTYSLKGA